MTGTQPANRSTESMFFAEDACTEWRRFSSSITLADTHTSGRGCGCNADTDWLTEVKPSARGPVGQVGGRSRSLVDTSSPLAKLNSAAATAATPTTEEEVPR